MQLILHTSTDVGESLCQKGERGVTLSCVCPHCLRFRLKTTSGGSRQGTAHVAASTTEAIRTESWSHGIVRTAVKQVCFERTLFPLELLLGASKNEAG